MTAPRGDRPRPRAAGSPRARASRRTRRSRHSPETAPGARRLRDRRGPPGPSPGHGRAGASCSRCCPRLRSDLRRRRLRPDRRRPSPSSSARVRTKTPRPASSTTWFPKIQRGARTESTRLRRGYSRWASLSSIPSTTETTLPATGEITGRPNVALWSLRCDASKRSAPGRPASPTAARSQANSPPKPAAAVIGVARVPLRDPPRPDAREARASADRRAGAAAARGPASHGWSASRGARPGRTRGGARRSRRSVAPHTAPARCRVRRRR